MYRLVLGLLLAVFHWPPAPRGTVVRDCRVNDSTVEGQPKVWNVRVTLKYPDGTEKAYVLGHREANEEKKALLDCYDATRYYQKLAKEKK